MTKAKSKLRIDLRAVVYKEDGFWLAHCLELDIVAEGKTGDEAVDALISLCETQVNVAIEEGDLSPIFRPAPSEYWRMFFSGGDRRTFKAKTRLPVERLEAREAVLA